MEELRKSLKVNPSFLIRSSLNQKVYLDPERNSYVFFDEDGANRFVQAHLHTVIDQADFRDDYALLSECYGQGAKTVILSNGRKQDPVLINPNQIERKYYNPNLNAAITLCRHAQKRNGEYLAYIAACKMIVPVKVDSDHGTQIIYGTVRLKGGVLNRIYIAFSDLEEYAKYAALAPGWEPLVVTFDVMCQISKEYGYMINPLGDKLILPQKLMKKYNDKWKAQS